MNANKQAVLVTGASGFVGRALVSSLVLAGRSVRAASRQPLAHDVADGFNACGFESAVVGDVNSSTDWRAALHGINTVVHLAARVHVMQDKSADPLAEFRRVNVAGTLRLAQQAVDAGVRRLVFISSIKVNGEVTALGCPYTADNSPAPVDAYGISKLEAEQCLLALAARTGLQVVIIRPVLIYGPGVKANFFKMMQWLNRGLPLPLGAIYNQRSMLALDNLLSLIMTCLDHPDAANQVFLASDGEDVSTTDLMHRTAYALGTSARLIPVPESVLIVVAGLLGKADMAQRLCGSLQADIAKTRRVLGWVPPLTLDAGLALAAGDYLRQHQG